MQSDLPKITNNEWIDKLKPRQWGPRTFAVSHPDSQEEWSCPRTTATPSPLLEDPWMTLCGENTLELRKSALNGGKAETQNAIGLEFQPRVEVWGTWLPTGCLDRSQGQVCVFSLDSCQCATLTLGWAKMQTATVWACFNLPELVPVFKASQVVEKRKRPT